MFKSSGSQVKQRFAWEPVFGLLLVVDVGRPASVNSVADGGVLGQLVLQVHDRLGAPDEEDICFFASLANWRYCSGDIGN